MNSGELVQEIHQVLLDREETCHRSCFALYLASTPLDNFTELRNVPGIVDGATLRVVEEPYTQREARIHLRHLRDLLRSLENTDALAATDCASLSFLNALTALDRNGRDSPRKADTIPPDWLLPGSKDRPLTPLHPPFLFSAHPTTPATSANAPPTSDAPALSNGHPPVSTPAQPLSNGHSANGPKTENGKEEGKRGKNEVDLGPLGIAGTAAGCMKKLGLSGWNPPPGNRKLHGDLLYLYVVTMEDKQYHITCCTKGFFVNQSTCHQFDSRPSNPKHLHHSLVELLSHLSPIFKRNFAAIQKRRCQRHIFERLPTPYQLWPWTAPAQEPLHTWDPVRAEDATQAHRLGFEDHIPGQIRDWNEELQTTRELPRNSLGERLIRERAIFKIHSDFVSAAVKGAVAVVDGNVMAINPGDEPKMQMFIWNNIFFSLGFDVKDHYKDLGGDAAAFVAPTNDLQGVRAYFALDQDKLYTLGTVVVDYRGLRVTAQSIIPGILEREQEQSVVYGSIDFGKTVVSSDKYLQLMLKPSQQLKIAPHKLRSENGDTHTLYSSAETKGIIGNDGRHYILDLLRTFPPDLNFLPGSELSDVCKANGFPREFPHKLASLRQELVDAFVEARYLMFIKIAAFHLQRLRYIKLEEGNDSAGAKVEEMKQEKQEETPAVPPSPEVTPVIELSEGGAAKEVRNGAKVEMAAGKESAVHDDQPAGCSTDNKPRTGEESGRQLRVVDGHVVSVDGAAGRVTVEAASGEAIAAEVKRKIVARSRSPTPDAIDAPLPLEEEAKRIMDAIRPTPLQDGSEVAVKTEAKEAVEMAEDGPEKLEPATAVIIAKAARVVSSLSDEEFSIRFNPDAFCPTVAHGDTPDELEKQRKLVKEAAHFLLVTQIPNLVRDCLDHSLTPVDGTGLSEAMHSRGINIRYLGKITTYIADIPQLSYLKVMCLAELVCRSTKHVFRGWLQSVEAGASAAAVAHFLNCLLGSVTNPAPPANANGLDELTLMRKAGNKAARRRRGAKTDSTDVASPNSAPWHSLSPKALWELVATEMDVYYGFQLPFEPAIDAFLDWSGVQRISLLRRFCKTVGIQLLLRDYALDSRSRPPFGDEDILNLFPKVKHIHPRATDALAFYQNGQSKIQNGQLRSGYEHVSEALSLLNNVYGAMHPEISQCLRLLARLAYILGDHPEALAQQHKAVLMSERCLGIDHPHTILEYMHLALYCFANLQVPTALRLLFRARYLLLLLHGDDHPQMALVDSNIGLILHAVQEYDCALKFLQNALALHIHYYGPTSLKTALTYHLIASAHSCRGDYRTALNFEKETFAIYKRTFGDDHEKTMESSQCLRSLTSQAVSFQKRMNEIARSSSAALSSASIASLLPLHQPTLHNVLDMLNVVNGIVFIQITPSDVHALRKEAQLIPHPTLPDSSNATPDSPQPKSLPTSPPTSLPDPSKESQPIALD